MFSTHLSSFSCLYLQPKPLTSSIMTSLVSISSFYMKYQKVPSNMSVFNFVLVLKVSWRFEIISGSSISASLDFGTIAYPYPTEPVSCIIIWPFTLQGNLSISHSWSVLLCILYSRCSFLLEQSTQPIPKYMFVYFFLIYSLQQLGCGVPFHRQGFVLFFLFI